MRRALSIVRAQLRASIAMALQYRLEFLVEGAARTRWFELDGLAYEPATRRVSIGAGGRSQFALTVEALDVTLRIRPQSRPR